jgi:hypothetical protein|tara:strand:+ start:377 stop:517 length:141 start_codon:yes stop_codon:yes gene_type:complete
MTKLKALWADNHDIAKATLEMLEIFVLAVIAMTIAPALILLTITSY